MKALETIDLSIGYGQTALSSNINVRLMTGQLVGLIGQNGVGKSTFLRTVCGFQRKLSGTMEVMGKEVKPNNQLERARLLSVVLTERPMAQNLTVLELISLGRHPYSGWLGKLNTKDIHAMEEAFEACQIHYLLDKRLYQLSDGQLQKVMIARALAQETDLIILDEPTSHLDLRNKVEVMELLKKISESGKAVLISTHEITLASRVCDLFWCMDFNSPWVIGEPNQLIASGKVQKILHVNANAL